MIDTITRVISPIPLPFPNPNPGPEEIPMPMPQKASMNNNAEGQVAAVDGGLVMTGVAILVNAGLAILAGIFASQRPNPDDGNDDNDNDDDDNE